MDIAALRRDLDGIRVDDNPKIVQQKSRDFYWYSPVLKRQLEHVSADLIVSAPDSLPRERGDPGDAVQEPLTPREIEVLELLAEGLPNKGIAARLGISDQTVKFHVAAIMGKLGASNRTDAVRRAVRRGLVSL